MACNHDTERLPILRQDEIAAGGRRGQTGFVPGRAQGPRAAGAQCEASPVLSWWKGARSGVSGGEGRQEPSLPSRHSRYPSLQAGRANCVCRWLSSTRDACGRRQGVSLALAKAEMISRAATGSTQTPEMGRAPLSPLDSSRCHCCSPGGFSAPALAPRQADPSSSPPLMQRGSWAYFILMFLLVSCCFSFPIVWRRAFPRLGQEGGCFPSTARLCTAASGEV